MMKKILTLSSFLFLTLGLFAQTVIKGKVIDGENNDALPGATIRAKSSNAIAVTDIDGNFIISLRDKLPQVLLVSYVGYRTAEVEATNNMEVKLTQQVLSAEEVVVSASRVEEALVKAAVTVEK